MTVSFRAEQPSVQTYNYQKDVKGGGFAAMIGGSAVTAASAIPLRTIGKSMHKAHTYTDAEVSQIREAANKIINKPNLAGKGVEIKYLAQDSNIPFLEQLINPIKQVQAGGNACFVPKDIYGIDLGTGKKVFVEKGNTVLMPEKTLQGSVFHELGHADNFHNSTFLRTLQKIRPVAMFLPAAILLYGAFSKKSKPKEGETELTKGQKANNFIRDNAGKLAFASMLPIIAEEAIATAKGHKWAKELVSKDIAKKALKGNLAGLATYITVAVAGGLAAYTAVKIKDKKIAKKEEKLQQEQLIKQQQQLDTIA